MTQAEAQALADVRGYALANRIEYGPHAWKRMRERGAKREDVREALVTATTCQAQPEERWKVTGLDTAGDAVTVIVVIRGWGRGGDAVLSEVAHAEALR